MAIDGPAAAGKGTIGRAVAAHFGFAHLDTGLLYRAVGVQALHDGRGVIDPHWAAELARRLQPEDLERADLRSARAGQAASKVAALPEVRAALLDFQKRFARRDGGAVLDGRDIGTVICPEAEAKLFVTASDEVRAERRQAELGAASLEEVLADLRARDARDAGRDVAPMAAAKDALLLDTTDLSIDAAVAEAVAFVESRFRKGRACALARDRRFASDRDVKTGGANRPARNIEKENCMPALATMDDFEALLNESFELETPEEGTVVKGTVLAIEAGQAIIDIGYKMEGRVDLKEFTPPGKAPEIAIGDVVEVYLDRVENARGEAVL